jgi:hypothetical protein
MVVKAGQITLMAISPPSSLLSKIARGKRKLRVKPEVSRPMREVVRNRLRITPCCFQALVLK